MVHMVPSLSVLSILFLQLFPRLALCSEEPSDYNNRGLTEMTTDSISKFASFLRGEQGDELLSRFKRRFRLDTRGQNLLLRYIIGSVAFFGDVDRRAWKSIEERFPTNGTNVAYYLCELLSDQGIDYNSPVAQYLATQMGANALPLTLVLELARTDSNNAEAFIAKTLGVLRNRNLSKYRYLIRCMPIRLRSKMVGTACKAINLITARTIDGVFRGHVLDSIGECVHAGALGSISDIFDDCRSDPWLREAVVAEVNEFDGSQSLSHLAKIHPPCEQFFADRAECEGASPELHNELWHYIFTLLDAEAACVLLLVCKSWKEAYMTVVMNDDKTRKYFWAELRWLGFDQLQTVRPWMYTLQDKEATTRYFNQCMESGAVDSLDSSEEMDVQAVEYLSSLMDGTAQFTVLGRAQKYDRFLVLFEKFHTICLPNNWQTFCKPDFATDADHIRAVRRYIYEERWSLKLPPHWVYTNIQHLFSNTAADRPLFAKLLADCFVNTSGLAQLCVKLIIQGQANGLPDGLAELVFSMLETFRMFSEPKLNKPHEYYQLIIDSDFFPKLLIGNDCISEAIDLLFSLIRHFRDQPEMIDRLINSIIGPSSKCLSSNHQARIQAFRVMFRASLKGQMDYTPEDVSFVDRTITGYGW